MHKPDDKQQSVHQSKVKSQSINIQKSKYNIKKSKNKTL